MKLFKSRNSKVETKGESTTEDKKRSLLTRLLKKIKRPALKHLLSRRTSQKKIKTRTKALANLKLPK
ncbi:hypothetical protein [Loigolactobacillus backii]|uniref:hypothetical protein n=1 Tax=Loigolactobacillus backii TaxID=375175 RepID=UPI0018865EF0|nr:hypothetical protein [Loigolactobacillus backii]